MHYRDPVESKPESEQEQKTAIVQLADMMCHAANVGSPEGYPKDDKEIMRLLVAVGFDEKTAKETKDKIVTETMEQFQNEKHVYE